ncbi:type II secretion system protein [methane-oxidizing endosymbiont of Gigantopelta aegis]|uniref:type II secretion system protein n=1 Tax=methane-oxidizing endosymbiont of Gigantopelta aegis TaxID=2794938 RepID=UPI0018DE7FA5|nr:type II secretion system protein [methane-oxidizing endosymbiont of Gigantopelta aegis]
MNKKMTQSFKQAGFTLLELLVVITLLAVLATGALVAYEGIGENANDTAAANALKTMEGALRNYRAVEGEYPEQFDLLANVDGTTTDTSGAMRLLAPETKAFFGQWAPTTTNANASGSVMRVVANAMKDVGIEELQAVNSNTTWEAGFVPNLALNESYPLATNPGSELAFVNDASGALIYDEATISSTNVALSIVPSAYDNNGTGTACSADSTDFSNSFDGTFAVADENTRLNLINDALGSETCTLVIALGIGKEVPGATAGSRVGIGQVATVGTNNINPNQHYARAIALFQVAEDGYDGSTPDGTIQASEVFPKARLVGVVDPEGRTVDEVIAAANAGN